MTAPATSDQSASGIWALFLGLGLLMVGNGLNGALIGVRSTSEGFSLAVTGVIMAGFFAGFLLAPTVVLGMLRRVGHIRVFAALASTASSAVLVHSVAVVPVPWTLMRFVFGFCIAGLYIVIESWLAEMTTPANRGRTMAVYMIVWLAGLGAGQYLIALADPDSFRLFVVSSVLVSLSLVPITVVSSTAPTVETSEKMGVRELIGIVPTGVLGSFAGGASVGILLGLGAVYATTVGLSLERTALFLAAPMVGAMVLQWPIGRLSDKVSRRTVIFVVAVAGAAVTVALALVPADDVGALVLMAGLGGTLFPLYSLIVSYTVDWVPRHKVTGAAARLIGINGSGAFLGPLLAAPLMAQFGASWFFWSMTAAFASLVGYLSWRLVFRDAMPTEQQSDYIPFPARAGPVAVSMMVAPVRKATARIAAGRRTSRTGSGGSAGGAAERSRQLATLTGHTSTTGDEPMDMVEFNKQVIAEFRANDGKVGGRFEGAPMVLVTMTGAKSGRELCSPLVYSTDGDDVVIIASKAGAPEHPNWYHNLVANPQVVVEVGTDRYEATAVLTEGEERTRLYDAQAADQPQFLEYAANAAKSGRTIPVFRLVRN